MATSSVEPARFRRGYWLWEQARTGGGDELNGIVLMVLGVLGASALVARNIKRCGLIVGVTSTLIQVGAFGALAYCGAFVFVIGVVLAIILLPRIQPVWVVNR